MYYSQICVLGLNNLFYQSTSEKRRAKQNPLQPSLTPYFNPKSRQNRRESEHETNGNNVCGKAPRFVSHQAFLLFDDLVKVLSDKIPGKEASVCMCPNS